MTCACAIMSVDVDTRGIQRGRCTNGGCVCHGYLTTGDGLKCVRCKHPPAKHENLSNRPSASHRAPNQTGFGAGAAGYPQYGSPLTYAQATGGSYSRPTAMQSTVPNPHLRLCAADGCTNPVHYEPDVGAFDYCSPVCRDRHLLPIQQEKLRSDLEEMTQRLRTAKTTGSQMVKFSFQKSLGEDLGLIIGEYTYTFEGTCGFLITGVAVDSKAFKKMEQKDIHLFDVIVKFNGRDVVDLERPFEDEVRARSAVEMSLCRSIGSPHLSKVIEEAKKRHRLPATHIIGLQRPPSFQGDFGFTTTTRGSAAESGLVVESVSKNTPARYSGLKFHDVILMYAFAREKTVSTPRAAEAKEKFEKAIAESKEALILIISRKKETYIH